MNNNDDEINDIFSDINNLDFKEKSNGFDNIEIHSLTINQQITKLSDVFVEWYLFDSSTEKSIDIFLVDENISDILNNDSFIGIMSGYNNISNDMIPLIQELLPFEISIEKLHKLNTKALKSKSFIATIKPDNSLINKKRKLNQKEKSSKLKKAKQQYMQIYNKQYQEQHSEELINYRKEYYATNKEEILKRQHKYNIINRKALLLQKKKYYNDNKETILEYQKNYYLANKEKIIKRVKKYAEQNIENKKEKSSIYYQKNKEKIIQRSHDNYHKNKDEINKKKREDRQKNKKKALLSKIVLSLLQNKEKQ